MSRLQLAKKGDIPVGSVSRLFSINSAKGNHLTQSSYKRLTKALRYCSICQLVFLSQPLDQGCYIDNIDYQMPRSLDSSRKNLESYQVPRLVTSSQGRPYSLIICNIAQAMLVVLIVFIRIKCLRFVNQLVAVIMLVNSVLLQSALSSSATIKSTNQEILGPSRTRRAFSRPYKKRGVFNRA